MNKKNRYLSFELLFALLLIIAFFLPWLDKWGIKIVGWDIPDLQKKMIRVGNFFKFFSKNKDWVYSTHVVYLIPTFSIIVMGLWLTLKQKIARVLLFITGIFSLVVSFNLFYKLPKAGSGVYLLCGTSILIIVYSIIIFRRNKSDQTELMSTSPEVERTEIE